MAGFTEGGVKLEDSVAKEMVEMMPELAAAGGPEVAAIWGAAAFTMEVIDWMTSDDTIPQALKKLADAIEHLSFIVQTLDARLDKLVVQVARESNRQTLRDLRDNYLDAVKDIQSQLRNLPPNADNTVDIANRAGLIVDRFLRGDFDIWRWLDVVLQETVDPVTGETREDPVLSEKPNFKNLPTLPVYMLAVLTWLSARERAVRLGVEGRLDGDAERVRQQLAAVSIRPVFSEVGKNETNPDGSIKLTPEPATLPEHIKYRIRGIIHASDKFAQDRTCRFFVVVENWMTGETKDGGGFDLVMDNNGDLCTVDPTGIAPSNAELDWEDTAGTTALAALADTLDRVANTGSVRRPFIGSFPNWVAAKSDFYAVNSIGQLLWFEHVWTTQIPGVPVSFSGPREIADGWDQFKFVLPAGGKAIYAVKPDGTLLWYMHEGAFDGSGTLSAPVPLDQGWDRYASVIPGGNGVIYAMEANGVLHWYKHDGFQTGEANLRKPLPVGSGWDMFKTILGSGDGILYGLKPDGTLMWYKHIGVADGTANWEGPKNVGSGWQNFTNVFAMHDGVIYAKQGNGPLFWYRLDSWPTGTAIKWLIINGRPVPASRFPVPIWQGPESVSDDPSPYRAMFGTLPLPPQGPH